MRDILHSTDTFTSTLVRSGTTLSSFVAIKVVLVVAIEEYIAVGVVTVDTTVCSACDFVTTTFAAKVQGKSSRSG